MKFVSTEQVFDALANAAVVEYAQRHWVRDWVLEKAGNEISATWGVPRGLQKLDGYGFAHGVPGWSL